MFQNKTHKEKKTYLTCLSVLESGSRSTHTHTHTDSHTTSTNAVRWTARSGD